MIIIVSGEGPTDIGSCTNGAGTCEGSEFQAGAMGHFIDRLVEPIWGYSPLESGAIICLIERELGRLSDRAKIVTLPGKKKAQGTGYFFKNAYALAKFAGDVEEENNCQTMAVLFRDSDGTRSTRDGLWEEKVSSINLGFVAGGYDRGVPMVPKPKSEVWLLCAIQEYAYQHCAQLESVSGNDRSPDSAKRKLEMALKPSGKTYIDIPDMVVAGEILPANIDMPSFNSFRERLEVVANSMIGQ